MGLFRKRTRLQRLVEPLSRFDPAGAAKSAGKALAIVMGTSLVSTVVSELRQRKEEA